MLRTKDFGILVFLLKIANHSIIPNIVGPAHRGPRSRWLKRQHLTIRFEYRPTFETRHDKTNKMSVRPAKTQISLGCASAQSYQPSLCTQWVAKDPRFLHADSEYYDQTGRMPRLIWVFAGRTFILLVLSCRGSFFVAVRRLAERSVLEVPKQIIEK